MITIVQVAALLVWVASPSKLVAQEVLRSMPDIWEPPMVGFAVHSGPFQWMGDIDGDAIDDFLVGQSTLSFDGLDLNGRVRIHSGKDAAVLRTYLGSGRNERLGLDVASFGDLDGDRIPDYMASRLPGGPFSFLWSGADGSELRRIETFDSTCDLGDLDEDGIPSYATSFGDFGGPGFVLVYDGLDVRYRLESPLGAVNYGLGLVGMGDLDGDGWADFAAAAPGEVFKGIICEPGQVFVHSGRTGDLLYSIDGPADVPSMFGRYMASPGDLNGDGLRDLVIAAHILGEDCLGQFGGDGQVSFHDGRTGVELGVFDTTQLPIGFLMGSGGRFGERLAGVGDLNGNGFEDVVASFIAEWPTAHSRGLLAAIDAGTHELIYVVPDQYGDECPGYRTVHPVGDVNGDGFPDFSASAPCLGSPGNPASRLDVISGAPLGVKTLGEPCKSIQGPEPRIGVSGLPLVGSNFRLYLSQVAPGQEAMLVLGSSATHWGRIPLPVALPGSRCKLWISPDRRIPARVSRIRPGEGAAEVALPIPDDPSLVGTTFYAQWLLSSAPGSRTLPGSSGKDAFPLHEHAVTRALAITIRAEALEIPLAGLVASTSPASGVATSTRTPTGTGPLLRGAGSAVGLPEPLEPR